MKNMYRLEIELYYWISDDIIRISPDKASIGRDSFESSGKLPGDTEFRLSLLNGGAFSPGFWIESEAFGDRRYRFRELDHKALSVLAGRGMDSGRINGRFCLTYWNRDCIPVPAGGPEIERLRADYVYRAYLWANSSLDNNRKGTRKQVPGHRYLSEKQVLVYLGERTRIRGRETVYLYAKSADISDKTRLSEVFGAISLRTDFSKKGVKGFQDREGTEEGKVCIHWSPTKPALIPTDTTPLIDDLYESIPTILEGWVQEFLVDSQDVRTSPKSRVTEFLYRSYILLGMTKEGPRPIGDPQKEVLLEVVSESLFYETLATETVHNLIESGHQGAIVPEDVRGSQRFKYYAFIDRIEDFICSDCKDILDLLSRIGVDEEVILNRTVEKLRESDPGSLQFKERILAGLEHYPGTYRFNLEQVSFVYSRSQGTLQIRKTFGDYPLQGPLLGPIQDILSGDPVDPEWRTRFKVCRVRLVSKGRSRTQVMAGSYLIVYLQDLIRREPSKKIQYLEECWKYRISKFHVNYED